MITVRVTGLVIPSAIHNVVGYVAFISGKNIQRYIYISHDITPNKGHQCVYILGIIF